MAAAPGIAQKRPGRRSRDLSGFGRVELVAPDGHCSVCGGPLEIGQHRTRPLQTLHHRAILVLKDRRCADKHCPGRKILIRPAEGGLIYKGREYGLDIICYVVCHAKVDFAQIPPGAPARQPWLPRICSTDLPRPVMPCSPSSLCPPPTRRGSTVQHPAGPILANSR